MRCGQPFARSRDRPAAILAESSRWPRCARQRQADLGHSLYTSIYQHITFVAEPGFDLFRDTTISWPLAKQGFDDLMLRYPKSFWNLNAYAILACMAEDRDSYQRVRPKIGNLIYTMLWPSNRSVAVCDAHLLGPKPP